MGAAGNSTKTPDHAAATAPGGIMLVFRRAKDELADRLSVLRRGFGLVARLSLRLARCRFG